MDHPSLVSKPTILIAPLDWGLGHATRCIPIIKYLVQQNCNVLLAGEGKIRNLLEAEFPGLTFLCLEGYRVRYSNNQRTLAFTMAAQVPHILSSVKKEKAWLRRVVEEYAIDAVISDNRYGLHHPEIPCVFITHQLRIKTPLGKIADDVLQRLNYRYIHQFGQCWVPDLAGENNLAGALSHPAKLPSVPVSYLGPLSRFTGTGTRNPKHLLVLLSGPEPQRTVLERLLLEQLSGYTLPVVFVRGLPGDTEKIRTAANICVHNHLPSEELQQKISEATYIISRCGYSTVMDLATLQKKSILIPTPGQTEQEYLARHLMSRHFALCVDQKKFHLKAALELAATFDYRLSRVDPIPELPGTIHQFAEQLRSKKTKPVPSLTNPAGLQS